MINKPPADGAIGLLCDFCQAVLDSEASLNTHKRRRHGDYAGCFKCLLCRVVFIDHVSFIDHVPRNHPEVDFKPVCLSCGPYPVSNATRYKCDSCVPKRTRGNRCAVCFQTFATDAECVYHVRT